MKTRTWIGIFACCLWASFALAAPKPPVEHEVNGVHLTTYTDEFGSRTMDNQGRYLIEEAGQWYYATIDSSSGESHLVKYDSIERSIPDNMAAYSDPVIDRQVREFNSNATAIVPVLGDIAVTFILVDTSWPGQPADPEHFWEWQGQQLDPQQFHDMMLLENYAQSYPNYVNQGGYMIPGSANDWWQWSSRGRSRLVADESRYPAGYVAPRPGWILNPATGLPFVLNSTFIQGSAVFWNMLTAAGIDITLDPRRPIVFLTHGQYGSRAHYNGYTILDMEQFQDSPLTIGPVVHEFGHCVLQLPDLYFDTPNNSFQLMNHGGNGYYDPQTHRYNLGYPSDLEPANKELLGWEDPVYVNAPGDYLFESDYIPFCVVNPNCPEEKIYINSWNLEHGFMSRHDPVGEGRLIIQHSSLNKTGWKFQDKPCPELIWSSHSAGDWNEAWPYGEHVVLDVENWETGTWFSWTLNTANGSDGREMLSFRVDERPTATAYVAMAYDPLMEEVPLNGEAATFSFVNLGPTFSGWTMSIGGETVSVQDTVAFNQTFAASFSSNIWGANSLGQDLNLPVSLYLQSLDTTIIVEQLRPFVGLRPSNWAIPTTDATVIETFQDHVLKAEGSSLTVYTNGQQGSSLGFVSEIKDLCFAGDETDHFAVIGEDWAALCRVQNNNFIIISQPVINQPIDAYALSNTPEFGWCLTIASNDRLFADRLTNGAEVFDVNLPEYIVPVNDLAYAGHDPIGDDEIGSRFCLVGGSGNSWVHVTNVTGDSLYARTAGNCGLIKNPLSLDLLGNGYYGFVVSVLTCVNNFGGYDEELWHISYSHDQGHHGVGIIDLGNYNPGYESGIEALVPYHNTDFPSREALVANDYFPYSDTGTDIKLFDLGHNDPEIRVLENVPPRRREFKVGNFNADQIHDLLVVDRGEGVRFWRGLGDLNFSDQGLIHRYSNANRSPVFCQRFGNLQLGFYEAGQLKFYELPATEWPFWARLNGVGNQRHMPNENWVAPSGPLNPPDISITRLGNGDMRLNIESISYGQQCSSFQVWFSTDQVNWTRLAEVLWDGQSATSWTHHRALYGNQMGFYRVVDTTNLDGGAIWSD